MSELKEVASRVHEGLIEMAKTLRAVEQPELAKWAEHMAHQLGASVYEELGETSVDIRLSERQESEGSRVEELAVVAKKMRKLRESMRGN